MHPGHLALPNGTGTDRLDDGERVVDGVAPNELTGSFHRDRFAGTPWHKSVPPDSNARADPVSLALSETRLRRASRAVGVYDVVEYAESMRCRRRQGEDADGVARPLSGSSTETWSSGELGMAESVMNSSIAASPSSRRPPTAEVEDGIGEDAVGDVGREFEPAGPNTLSQIGTSIGRGAARPSAWSMRTAAPSSMAVAGQRARRCGE